MCVVSIDESQLRAACTLLVAACMSYMLCAHILAHAQILACSTYSAYVQDMVKISVTCKPHMSRLHSFMCATYVQHFCKGDDT